MKRILKISIPLLLLLVIVWAVRARFEVEVPVAAASTGSAVNAVTGTVKVFGNIDLRVKTEVQGTVLEIPVTLGQEVKQGDILCRLDSRDIELQLEQRKIQLEAARKRLELPITTLIDIENATEDVERLRQQVQYGGASRAELERRERELEKLQTVFKGEQIQRNEQAQLLDAQVAQLEHQLERMTIRAPFDGRVVEQYAWQGAFLYSGNEILRIVSPGRYVEITLAEEDFYGVKEGQKATLRLASYPNEPLEGTVTFLAAFADANRKTRTAFLSVDASDEKLVPGLSGEAILVKDERAGSTIVPRRALIGRRVYVVKNGNVEIREVEPGFLSLNKAEIISGISPGEMVVLEGQSQLRNGDSVTAVAAE